MLPQIKLHYASFSLRNFVFILKNIDLVFITKRIGDYNLNDNNALI